MLNTLFKNKYILLSLQIITLLVFVLLIIESIGITTDDAHFAKILRNTNLANLIVWSYWWPLIIATAILFGRYWCSVCPMELITSLFGKIGLRKKPGKILKSGWVITLFYAIILIIGIHSLAIHRIPHRMAIYMLILLTSAILVGFVWEKRTFCTYVCPIGHLLGLYSLLSFNKLGVKNKDICKSCKTKDCISKSNHYKFNARSCTSELYPPTITNNKDCILCGQCYKSCINDNIIITKRRYATDLLKNIELKWSEMGFFMIVSAFVVYEILSEWSVSKAILMSVPNYINGNLELSGNITGTVKAISLFVIIPSIIYFILVLLKKIWAKESFKSGFNQIVLALLPIAASMHLLKALLKTTSRIPYWQYAVSDIEGIKSAKNIMENKDLLNNDFLSNFINPTINVIAIILPVLGLILSFIIVKNQNHSNNKSRLISWAAAIVYATLFIITLIEWRWLH